MSCNPIMVFSASLTKHLGSNEVRLPPTCIGVRRVRPTSKFMRDALYHRNSKRAKTEPPPSSSEIATTNSPKQFHEKDDADDDSRQQDLNSDGDGMASSMDVVVDKKSDENDAQDDVVVNPSSSREDEPTCVTTKNEAANIGGAVNEKPSSHAVSSQHPDQVCYKVMGEDGKERRMSKQEKKVLKFKLKQERAAQKKMARVHNHNTTNHPALPTNSVVANSSSLKQEEEAAEKSDHKLIAAQNNGNSMPQSWSSQTQRQKRNYFQLTISKEAFEEELAELHGERVPPAILSTPIAQKALRSGLFQQPRKMKESDDVQVLSSKQPSKSVVVIDDDLAIQWANEIKQSMKEAEFIRVREQIRPMAYHIVPELWTRLRPRSSSSSPNMNDVNKNSTNTTASTSEKQPVTSTSEASSPNDDNDQTTTTTTPDNNVAMQSKDWSFIKMRKPIAIQDEDLSIVFDQLYQLENIHVSCGAKFGSDFLLYDGNREERHAFAGIRIVSMVENNGGSSTKALLATTTTSSTEEKEDLNRQHLPLPSAYDLAGFVRGLNTAGKLALLATVIRNKNDSSVVRVAFVDLALEKILSAPTHRKKQAWNTGGGRGQKRKEIGKHLAKTKN